MRDSLEELKFGHSNKKCISSSKTPSIHLVHKRSALSFLVYLPTSMFNLCNENISLEHVFSCTDIYLVPRKMFIDRVFQHLLRDPAGVNAMKQISVIVILAYFTRFQPKAH